jgi:hypothetical protein
MTISSTANRTSTDGDGSAVNFSFPYLFFNQNDLTVILVDETTNVETTQTITTHYTVTGAGVAAGGTVIMGTAPTTNQKLVIQREEQYTQTLDLVENDPFPSDLVEQQFDTLTMLTQQLKTLSDRSVKLSDGDFSGADPTLATPVAEAFLKWDAAGTALTSSSTAAGQSLGGNGTVSLPYYSFSADPNTGMYRVGADNVGLSVGGSKVVDVTSTGINSTVIGATTAAAGTFSSVTSGGDVLSDTDSTDSLGSTGVRWLKLWVDSIQTTANTDIAGNLTVTGNLTINGTTVTNDATNTEIKDPLIEINSGASSNANDLGLLMERGSTGDNAFLGWDESGDYFVAATTTATGASTGNITYAYAPFKCSALTATSGTLAGITSLGLNAGATITAGILDEDAMGSDSAVALATQQSIKAYTDNNAPENGVKFAFETTTTDTDQGAGKVWLNHGTPSSATVLYVDDVEAGSVSVNAWVDTWDDVSNAVARGYVYIASYGTTNAILVYKVTGSVTSASTYSKIAVTHVLTVGTISDGDNIGLTFIPSGADGAGDLAAANNLSDVASASTAFTNIKQAASASATGVVELATAAEVNTGTDTARVVTADTLEQQITGATTAVVTASDEFLFADVGSSNARKKDTVEGILDLISGTSTVWIPSAAMRPTSSNGCAAITDVETTSGRPDLQVLDFDTSADEHAQFQIGFPKSWNEGTITFRVFWTSPATDTDGVAWALQGVSVANDGTIDVAYGTAIVVTDDNISAAEDCLVTATSAAVTIASAAADTMTFFRIFRDISDGNDDMAEDARLIGVQIFYTTDAVNDD